MSEQRARTPEGVRKRVHKRADGTESTLWYARLKYRDGSGRPRETTSRGFRTRREAEAERTRMKAARLAGTFVAPSAMTVSQYFEDAWLPSVRARVKASTFDSYERSWKRHIKPALGEMRVQAVNGPHLDALYAALAEDRSLAVFDEDGRRREEQRKALSAKSIGNLHQVLLKAFGDAVDSEVLARNPASRAKPPRNIRRPEQEMVVWSDDQLRSFLAGIEDKRWYPHLRLAAMTGMRRGEVLGLRWGDVDLDAKRLTVRQALVSTAYKVHFDTPKSHKPRTIDLDDRTCRVLKRQKAKQAEEHLLEGAAYLRSDLVFTDPTGALTHPDALSQAMDRLVAARPDLPRIPLHGLRHTHATLLLKAGVPVKVVSERLGHADPGFTLRQYAHVLPAMQADAVAKIAAMVDG